MHVPAPLPAGGAPQRPCASVPLTPALSPKRAVAAPLQATDHLSNPAPTALPTAARDGSARMDGTAWRVGTGSGALQVRPPNGRGRGEQTSPPHGGGERRFRATGACRLQARQAECFFKSLAMGGKRKFAQISVRSRKFAQIRSDRLSRLDQEMGPNKKGLEREIRSTAAARPHALTAGHGA